MISPSYNFIINNTINLNNKHNVIIMMMTKIVFLDFDGTTYSHKQKKIPDSTIEAVKRLHQNNILVFLCTGRTYCEFNQFDISNFYYDGMILANGQLAVDNKGNIIYDKPISGELKDKLLQIFDEKKLSIYLAGKDDMFLNMVNDALLKAQHDVSSGIPEIKPYNNENFYMVSAFYRNNEEYQVFKQLDDIAQMTHWHDYAIDIVPKGINKASGIDDILRIYNLDISQTLGIGDGDNDLEMLRHCHIGIAMGNSIDEIKEISDYITDDIDNDGLYNALKHYNLI